MLFPDTEHLDVGRNRVLVPAERQYYLNARISGLIDNLYKRTDYVKTSDGAAWDLVVLIAKADKEEVRVENIDRVADMLLSKDRGVREFVARAFAELGPSANRSARAIPALRGAIAEEIAIIRSSNPIHTGPVDLLSTAQLSALSSVTGEPFEYLHEHPELFEQLPLNMEVCRSENSEEYCDQLLAE